MPLAARRGETSEAISSLRKHSFSTIRRPGTLAAGQEAAEKSTAQRTSQSRSPEPRWFLAGFGTMAPLSYRETLP
jgi:hypothetical protein